MKPKNNTEKFYLHMAIALMCLLAGLSPVSQSTASEISGYRLKALYIYNLALFTEWPPEFFLNNKNITIGILGKDPFGDSFSHLEGRELRGREVVIRRFENVEDLEACHILFISPSEKDRMSEIVEKIKGWRVLTVSDMPNFARLGGIVGLVMDNDGETLNNRIIKRRKRFEINLGAADQAGLKIRSRFLRLADIIWNGPASKGKKNGVSR